MFSLPVGVGVFVLYKGISKNQNRLFGIVAMHAGFTQLQ